MNAMPNISKKIFVYLLLSVACSCGYRVAVSPPWKKANPAGDKAVNFLKSDFAGHLDSAVLAGRPVFIDFYTDWCGPCRTLDRDVFIDAELASYFNGAFLNLKINAEKGEGIEQAQNFGIKAYPTLVFLDARGVEKKRIVGLASAAQLRKAGRRAAGNK